MLKGIFRFLAGKIIAIELAHSLMAYFIISLAFGPKLPARYRIPAFKSHRRSSLIWSIAQLCVCVCVCVCVYTYIQIRLSTRYKTQ
jgi:hypothetical protein